MYAVHNPFESVSLQDTVFLLLPFIEDSSSCTHLPHNKTENVRNSLEDTHKLFSMSHSILIFLFLSMNVVATGKMTTRVMTPQPINLFHLTDE